MTRKVFEIAAFSGLWEATAACLLTAAAAKVFAAPASLSLLGLAFAGTLGVYGIDRLRDLPRDRTTLPRRSAFVETNRTAMIAMSAAAVAVAGGCAFELGWVVLVIAAIVGELGLLHRRLKGVAYLKGVYVTGAWLAVTVMLPALVAPAMPPPSVLTGVLVTVGLALAANAIASSARDDEALAVVVGRHRAIRVALVFAACGSIVGLLSPMPVRSLAPIALASAGALVFFRFDETYAFVLDGALAVGALLTLL